MMNNQSTICRFIRSHDWMFHVNLVSLPEAAERNEKWASKSE